MFNDDPIYLKNKKFFGYVRLFKICRILWYSLKVEERMVMSEKNCHSFDWEEGVFSSHICFSFFPFSVWKSWRGSILNLYLFEWLQEYNEVPGEIHVFDPTVSSLSSGRLWCSFKLEQGLETSIFYSNSLCTFHWYLIMAKGQSVRTNRLYRVSTSSSWRTYYDQDLCLRYSSHDVLRERPVCRDGFDNVI